MKRIYLSRFAIAACLAWAFPSAAQVVYTAPANKMGGAIASGIAQTLMRRGFAANDPRIVQTVASVGARVVPLAASAGSGATWLSMVSRLSPWVTGGVLVYQGITWYYDLQGKTYLAPPGTVTSTPIFSNGIAPGQPCWGLSFDCFGSPQEALAFMFSTSKAQYPTASYGVPTLTQNSPTQYTAQYNYSIPELGLNNYSGTKIISSHTAAVVCPAGYGYSGSGQNPSACVSAGLANSPYAGGPVVGYAQQQAYENLPDAAKSASISPDLVSELANRIWKDAASQPDYSGVPFSPSAPVTPGDLAPQVNNHPADWPKTSGLVEPVPTTGASPIALPTSNPNQTLPPAGATKVDLGPDPGTPPPTLEEPPTDLFKPISDAMQPLLSWRVPSHSSTCPTWQANPSIAGHVFAIDVSYHCTLADQYRALIQGIATAAFAVMVVFIILDA